MVDYIGLLCGGILVTMLSIQPDRSDIRTFVIGELVVSAFGVLRIKVLPLKAFRHAVLLLRSWC